jgi:hypothetical protein
VKMLILVVSCAAAPILMATSMTGQIPSTYFHLLRGSAEVTTEWGSNPQRVTVGGATTNTHYSTSAVFPGPWTGISQQNNEELSFDVSPSGTECSQFTVAFYNECYDALGHWCGGRLTSLTMEVKAPITDGQFSVGGSLTYSGTFTSATTATGQWHYFGPVSCCVSPLGTGSSLTAKAPPVHKFFPPVVQKAVQQTIGTTGQVHGL